MLSITVGMGAGGCGAKGQKWEGGKGMGPKWKAGWQQRGAGAAQSGHNSVSLWTGTAQREGCSRVIGWEGVLPSRPSRTLWTDDDWAERRFLRGYYRELMRTGNGKGTKKQAQHTEKRTARGTQHREGV